MKEKKIYYTFEKETKEFTNSLFYFSGKVIIFLYDIQNNIIVPFDEEIEYNIDNIHRVDDLDIINMVESVISNHLYEKHNIKSGFKLSYL
ncbi:MAG: hypothetical protein PF487_08895 [Bacteroidales bacterium]|jgi:hypothetical protein|nr:hypothetical protein [Bacteroidales bacterium]